MSTYLACFIVCDFERLPPKKSKHGFDVTVYAREGQISKMDYALQIATSTVEYYIDYFSINYPLPKLGKHLSINYQLVFKFTGQPTIIRTY